MTNDDLKRLYNINAKPQQKKDFARYDENGRLKAKAGVEDDDVATVGQLGGGTDNALTKPTTTPSATQIVAVDNTNTQTMLNIGDGLSVENGSLKASGGGTGNKLYYKKITLKFLTENASFPRINEIYIYFYESNDTLYDISNINTLYEKIEFAICNFYGDTSSPTAIKWILGCEPQTSNLKFYCLLENGVIRPAALLYDEIDDINITLFCDYTEV